MSQEDKGCHKSSGDATKEVMSREEKRCHGRETEVTGRKFCYRQLAGKLN